MIICQKFCRTFPVSRDEVDYLPEDRVYCLRCFWWCLLLHNPVGYRITPPVATLNIHPFANAVSEWDANETCNIHCKLTWHELARGKHFLYRRRIPLCNRNLNLFNTWSHTNCLSSLLLFTYTRCAYRRELGSFCRHAAPSGE